LPREKERKSRNNQKKEIKKKRINIVKTQKKMKEFIKV
jgi:hypothetical protein